jgi:cytochrome c oxidase cbb3-type subunit 3
MATDQHDPTGAKATGAKATGANANGVNDVILDHDYDGIQEYDNPMPRWWLMLFYGGIIFAAVYIPWYLFGGGPLAAEELAMEITEAQAALPAAAPEPETPAEDPYASLVGDAGRIAKGKVVYDARCVACHGPDGGGLVGPNLTDRAWKHGGKPADLVKVIKRGVPGTAMVAWNKQLSEDEIVDVSIFIKSLKGTTPANPKASEGVESND